MIRSVLGLLQQEVNDRGFGTLEISRSIERLIAGIDFLESLLNQETKSSGDQHKLDIIYDGIEKNVMDLKSTLRDIDGRLGASVSGST
jgi:hypothetical protein